MKRPKSASQNGLPQRTVLGTLRSRLNAICRIRREFQIGRYPVAVIGDYVYKSNREARTGLLVTRLLHHLDEDFSGLCRIAYFA